MEEVLIEGHPRSWWISRGYKILEFEVKVTKPDGQEEYHRQVTPVKPNNCGVE